MFWDLAIVETGNGGDLQMVGADLGVVNGIENMPYLAMFGGNVEAVTKSNVVLTDSKDFWGNNLLWPNNPGIQWNSIVEKTLNTTALNSAGRVIIENAIKSDLAFLSQVVKIDVAVTIVATDRINVKLIIKQETGATQVKVINYKKSADGDYWILDFNDDYNV